MKILQVLPSLNAGGVERGTLELAEKLSQSGHDSWVLSAGGRLQEQLEKAGSQHITLDIGRKSLATFSKLPRLVKILRDGKFDIIHVRSRLPAWMIRFALALMPKNERPHLISTLHGLHSVNAYSAIMGRAERVIVVSETAEKYLRNNYPQVNPDCIRVIHRGIDPEQFPYGYQPDEEWLQQWRDQYPQLEGRPLIGLIGRVCKLKGQLQLVETLAALVKQHPDAVALVVGDEPQDSRYVEQLHQRIDELQLQDNILFTGFRRDVREISSQCAAVLSLSTKPESFGRSVLEALSLGVPVFGYEHGGAGEILRSLYPEGAVPTGDTQAMAARLAARLRGEIGQPEPHQQFRLQDTLQRTIDVYREVCPA